MENQLPIIVILFILIIASFIAAAVWTVYMQQEVLKNVRPENRKMKPAQVWRQFIPVYNIYWMIVVINKVADSIQAELTGPIKDPVFDESESEEDRPTFKIGLAYYVACCIMLLTPIRLQAFVYFPLLTFWIVYGLQIAECKRRLELHRMMLNAINSANRLPRHVRLDLMAMES